MKPPRRIPGPPPIQQQFVPMAVYQQLQQQLAHAQDQMQQRTNLIVGLLRQGAAIDGVLAAEQIEVRLTDAELRAGNGWTLHYEQEEKTRDVILQLAPPAPAPEGATPPRQGSGILVVGADALRGLKRVN